MNSKKIKPHFIKKTNPRVGLIVLATDVMIEKDFLKPKPLKINIDPIQPKYNNKNENNKNTLC